MIAPQTCVFIDINTILRPSALHHLLTAFDRDPHLAGACGEIMGISRNVCILAQRLLVAHRWMDYFHPIVAAQIFEYKLSHILDKPMESAIGHVTVLPGAFSAYRYSALIGESTTKRSTVSFLPRKRHNVASTRVPLDHYFQGEAAYVGRVGEQGNIHTVG